MECSGPCHYGSQPGASVLIPRINLTCPDTDQLSIRFTRRQLPIRVAFAMTINRAQGQAFPHLGLYLMEPVFTHGQLYVGLSRATNREFVRVVISSEAHYAPDRPDTTRNVVWPELLR